MHISVFFIQTSIKNNRRCDTIRTVHCHRKSVNRNCFVPPYNEDEESVQDELQYISSYTSKLLRKEFGKGPKQCRAYHEYPFLVIHIQEFISPLEIALTKQGEIDTAYLSRNTVVNGLLSQLKGVVEERLQQDIEKISHDWDFERNTGVILIHLQNEQDVISDFPESSTIIEEVNRISKVVQKVPEQTTVYKITPSIYVCIRRGILTVLEKALIKKGFESELRITKSEIEKKYFTYDINYRKVFGESIDQIFVDWHLHEDFSTICMILNSQKGK